jgi:hypothetical protein
MAEGVCNDTSILSLISRLPDLFNAHEKGEGAGDETKLIIPRLSLLLACIEKIGKPGDKTTHN